MRLRAPVPDDARAVLAVITARELADLGAPDYTLADLEDEWRLGEFDLARDACVVENDDGVIVAYAAVRHPGTFAVVSPEHEGRGIGTRVLGWAERRERELGRSRHVQWIAGANERAAALLRADGYTHVRSYWRMIRELGDEVSVEPSGSVSLRQLDLERDAVALHALDAAAFSANADYRPESFEHFRAEHLLAHDLAPTLSWVAEDEGEIVGFLLARHWTDERVGFIDLLGVAPEHQRRGLGTALLRTGFAGFADAGLREAQLGVASDNSRGLTLYERAGMSPRFRFDTYERPVDQILS